MNNLQTVQAAKKRLEDAAPRVEPANKSTLAAHIAVLNADEIDRRTGLTFEPEVTPGLNLARLIVA